MSKHTARNALARMNLKAALVAPTAAESFAADMRELAEADPDLEEHASSKRLKDMARSYGFEDASADKPFLFSNGVAVIPVHGSLINRFSGSYGYVTGYNFISAQFDAAMADEDVEMIVFDCNSYGGEVAGCFELADKIFAGRTDKPSLAVVDSSSYSACYAIASSASKIAVTPSAGVGSVGVVAMHVNYGPLLEKVGLEVTFIHAGAHKVDGNPYEALSDEVKADIQASVDKSYAKFVASVSRGRNITAQKVKATEARTYDAEDAMSLGLIDAVQMPSEALAAFRSELSGSTINQEQTMSTQNKGPDNQQAAAPDAAAIKKAERERMSAITGSEEAKGKSGLANHLAFNTEMSVEDAKAVLAAAAPEVIQGANADDDGKKKAGGDDTFKQHMDNDKHPNVGAGGNNPGGEQKVDKVARVLAASGFKKPEKAQA